MPCFRGTSISQVAQLKREIQYQVFHRRWNQKRAFFAIFPTAGEWGGSHKGSAIHPIFYCPFPEWSCSVSLCAADLSWPTADMEMGLRFYGPNGLDTVKLRGHEYWMLFLLPFYVIHCQYIINRWYHIQNYWTKHYRAVLWKELYVAQTTAENTLQVILFYRLRRRTPSVQAIFTV